MKAAGQTRSRTVRTAGATLLLALAIAPGAAAQPRVWISINTGMQAPAASISDRFEFERFVEQATADVDYDGDAGVFFDGGVSIRLWKRLGAGVAVSRLSHDGGADVDARIPHPFFDDRHREISGNAGGVTRGETGVHMQVTYTADTGGAWKMVLSGGPSYLNVEQELVTGVRYTESFPFDEAAFAAADITRTKDSGLGFNAGADLTWMLGRQWGIGGLVRYSRAPVTFETDDGRAIEVKAGGLVAGAGVRIQF